MQKRVITRYKSVIIIVIRSTIQKDWWTCFAAFCSNVNGCDIGLTLSFFFIPVMFNNILYYLLYIFYLYHIFSLLTNFSQDTFTMSIFNYIKNYLSWNQQIIFILIICVCWCLVDKNIFQQKIKYCYVKLSEDYLSNFIFSVPVNYHDQPNSRLLPVAMWLVLVVNIATRIFTQPRLFSTVNAISTYCINW